MLSKFFINRPRFATVISIVIVIIGLIALKLLPVQEYPSVVPPTVMIQAVYPGADADTLAKTVAAPLEESINGVKNMIYMTSTASPSGILNISVVFEVGTDPKQANVEVNNRIQIAQSKLPEEVRRQGITVRERSPDILQVIAFTSEDNSHTGLWLNNYINNTVVDELKRVKGVGDAFLFGNREYAIRIWIEPDKSAKYNITINDILSAIRNQNIQIAAGNLGEEPQSAKNSFTYTITTPGRLKSPEEFENIILRSNPDGSKLVIKDIAKVELGAERYLLKAFYNGREMAPVGIFLAPGANALETAKEVNKKLKEISSNFPKGVKYTVAYDTTKFIEISINEVLKTLIEALIYVTLVLFIFLGKIRSTIIPSLAIPVSIIGTFAGMYLLGFSINMLTLFGLILSIGLVVDDAIIVIENTERILHNNPGISTKEATLMSMKEIQGPVIANVLVLFAVFVPVAFMGGFSGVMYRQFAVTIVISMFISGIVALTLTPALCATILKNQEKPPVYPLQLFHRLFEWITDKFSKTVALTIKYGVFNLIIFLGLTLLAIDITKKIPTNLVPEEDKGALMIISYLMPGSSLQRTELVQKEITDIILKEGNFTGATAMAGLDIAGFAYKSDSAVMFAKLKDWDERKRKDQSSFALAGKLYGIFSQNKEALIFPVNPPPIMGMSNTGGFEVYLQDRTGGDPLLLGKYVQELVTKANQRSELTQVRSNYNPNVPQYRISVDKEKAKAYGIEISDIYSTLNSTLGTSYANDFNLSGKTYHVNVQLDEKYRKSVDDLSNIYIKNNKGIMIPVSNFIEIKKIVGPSVIQRFNMFNAAQITGQPKYGFSSGDAIKAIEEVAKEVLPPGYTIDYAGSTFQEKRQVSEGSSAFWYAILFIFLILVALYESWTLPIVILLTVPIAILGASSFVFFRGLANNVYFQVGLITLIGLTAKNAILIVEFAQQKIKDGSTIFEAAIAGSKIRFRPIMMTALTFILGALPLAIAQGAGANSRIVVGTTVVGGMILVTFVGIFWVPLFYYILMNIRSYFKKIKAGEK
ncbi:MAG: multidrug efflux RND transporter permease subunit [Calditerrivibrio sp.]|nr:multidrug efflux RND transporter permease subunit [Calditerrivibrio sp.]